MCEGEKRGRKNVRKFKGEAISSLSNIFFSLRVLFLPFKQWGEFESILNYQPRHCLFINPFMCVTDVKKNPDLTWEFSGQALSDTEPIPIWDPWVPLHSCNHVCGLKVYAVKLHNSVKASFSKKANK